MIPYSMVGIWEEHAELKSIMFPSDPITVIPIL